MPNRAKTIYLWSCTITSQHLRISRHRIQRLSKKIPNDQGKVWLYCPRQQASPTFGVEGFIQFLDHLLNRLLGRGDDDRSFDVCSDDERSSVWISNNQIYSIQALSVWQGTKHYCIVLRKELSIQTHAVRSVPHLFDPALTPHYPFPAQHAGRYVASPGHTKPHSCTTETRST
jgi:hypothetical protein